MIPYIEDSRESRHLLSDTISCVVTEERNGKYELKMTCDVSGENVDMIELFGTVYVKPNDDDDDQEFRIYRITKTLKGRLTIYGEHISYKMSGWPVMPFTYTGNAAEIAEEALSQAWGLYFDSFEFATDISISKEFTLDQPRALRAILLGEEGSILQKFQGEWKFDNRKATLMQSRGKDTNVSIVYGKNITDLTYDDSIADVYNAILPFWYGDYNGVPTLVTITHSVPLVYTNNNSSFPYPKGMVVDLTSEFSSKPTSEQLYSAAESYIANNGVGTPDISINVNFVPLWQVKGLEYLRQLEKVSLCDTVSVIVPHLNIATNAKVVETQYNVLKERYDSIKIGTVKKNFVGKISGDLNNIRSVVDQLKRMR